MKMNLSRDLVNSLCGLWQWINCWETKKTKITNCNYVNYILRWRGGSYLNTNNETLDFNYLSFSLFEDRNEQIFFRFKYSFQPGEQTVDISKLCWLPGPGERMPWWNNPSLLWRTASQVRCKLRGMSLMLYNRYVWSVVITGRIEDPVEVW